MCIKPKNRIIPLQNKKQQFLVFYHLTITKISITPYINHLMAVSINIYTPSAPFGTRQQGLERREVVAVDYHVLAAVAENVFLFQYAEGHVHVMVYDLIFTNPFKRRHIFFCFLRADSSYKNNYSRAADGNLHNGTVALILKAARSRLAKYSGDEKRVLVYEFMTRHGMCRVIPTHRKSKISTRL